MIEVRLKRPLPDVTVEVETPYRLYERPRAKGRVLAAGRDEDLARWNVGGTGDPDFISNRDAYHPGARVVVDTKPLGVRLPKRAPIIRRTGRRSKAYSQHRLMAAARKYGYWPFRLCYEDALRKDQTDHGQTVFHAHVDGAGNVGGARLIKSKLSDKDAVRCLKTEINDLEFKPAPGRKIRFELSIKLWPGDAPVPLVDPPTGVEVENPGELDVDDVARRTKRAIRRARRCYAKGVRRDARLWGRVQLNIHLDAKGRTRSVRERESRFPDRRVLRCIVKRFRRVRYAPPKGGALRFVLGLRLGQPPAEPK